MEWARAKATMAVDLFRPIRGHATKSEVGEVVCSAPGGAAQQRPAFFLIIIQLTKLS